MPSPFARITAEVHACVAAIPRGRVTTFGAIGGFLDVMPRHVAYVLARLDDEQQMVLPWYRVVSAEGRLPPKALRDPLGRTQVELLRGDGVPVDDGAVGDFARRAWTPTTRGTGVTPTPHPGRRRTGPTRGPARGRRPRAD